MMRSLNTTVLCLCNSILLTLALLFLGGCFGSDEPEEPEERRSTALSAIESEFADTIETASGLRYYVEKEGAGPTPEPGDLVYAHYRGTLLDGTEFDSSYDNGQPFAFEVGEGRVIKGWDEAFLGMKKGEHRKLIIPSKLGYGMRGAGGVIPPNATLIFEVELVNFETR